MGVSLLALAKSILFYVNDVQMSCSLLYCYLYVDDSVLY